MRNSCVSLGALSNVAQGNLQIFSTMIAWMDYWLLNSLIDLFAHIVLIDYLIGVTDHMIRWSITKLIVILVIDQFIYLCNHILNLNGSIVCLCFIN